jgi:hypothetical protein
MRGRRLWAIIGGVLGAIAVSGGLVAVLGNSENDAEGQDESAEETLAGAQEEWRHEFPESHAGQVWITVEAPDDEPRMVTITWGEWERRVTHTAEGPRTYVFTKDPGPTVPTVVRAEPAAVVEFGAGAPPDGSENVDEGWTRVS